MELLRKYGESTTVYFPLITKDDTSFETGATFASGDTQIIADGAAATNTTNNPTHEGNGVYSLALTASEMQSALIQITVIDQTATKVWEDQAIEVATYGHASAAHALDLDSANVTVGTNNDKSGYSISGTKQTLDALNDFDPTSEQVTVTTNNDKTGYTVDTNNDKSGYSISGTKTTLDDLNDFDPATDTVTPAADSIDESVLAGDTDVYDARVWVIDDETNSTDRWLVLFYKNGAPVDAANISSPTITVTDASTGTDLLTGATISQVGTTDFYKREEASSRMVNGRSYGVTVSWTQDSGSRSSGTIIGRDSS